LFDDGGTGNALVLTEIAAVIDRRGDHLAAMIDATASVRARPGWSVAIAVVVGILAAVRANSWIDQVAMTLALLGVAFRIFGSHCC
jgi:ABC-type antimicrobial peptide transport system permease subunit